MKQMNDGMIFNQREIVLVPFPYSDLTGAKQRPALILSNNTINRSQDRICCLVTSNPTTEGVRIKNKDFEGGMLPFQSWVKPHRLFTIHEKIIKKRLCAVSKDFFNTIFIRVSECINQAPERE